MHHHRDSLLSILRDEDVSVLFQPIVSGVEKSIVGYEALTRGPSNSPLHSPLALFACARKTYLLSELEMLCRRQAVRAFTELGLSGFLFINVSPESLMDAHHSPGCTLQILRDFGMKPERLVIELTEHAPVDEVDSLQVALNHYRSMGFSIAIDDLGAGYSSLRLWTELQPEFVKIDRHFIDGIHRDPVKREFVGSILTMAKASRSHVVAEGVEQADEYKALSDMGVDWMQGYWFERPRDVPELTTPHLREQLSLADEGSVLEIGLHSLVIPVAGVSVTDSVSDVLLRFQQQPSLNTLAVLDDDDVPVGTVHCHALSQIMLKPYAKELHGRKAIVHLMAEHWLVVDVQQSLQRISRLLTSRARQRLEEDFVIVEHGKYLGLGRVIDVLRQITELQIRQAQSANPLTLLPGNISIHECLERLLRNRLSARLCYIDLDSFKPFNDIYGYGAGDRILLGLAQILRELCDPACDFVGHIGGDDFMLVLRSDDWQHRLQQLDKRFQALCQVIYRDEHWQQGWFEAPDRDGNVRRHELLNLSVGIVVLDGRGLELTPQFLAEQASLNKYQAKKQRGFSVYVSSPDGRTKSINNVYAA